MQKMFDSKSKLKISLKSVQGPQNVFFWFAPANQTGLKGKDTRLKQLSEQFVREMTYKGGRDAPAS